MIQKANNPKLKALLEAAKRATEDALHGPPHLRSGRYHPTPSDAKPVTPPVSKDAKQTD